jgi:hypothetical protein
MDHPQGRVSGAGTAASERAFGVPETSQARNGVTGTLGHVHWFTYTEDPAGVPGKYRDGKLAQITRSQTFAKERRGENQVRETFSAVADRGEIHLSLYPAEDPGIERRYQEDQVMYVVRSDPLKINRVSTISLNVKGELEDLFDGNDRVVAVVIQRPYMRRVYVP